jgi:hypothetical protein
MWRLNSGKLFILLLVLACSSFAQNKDAGLAGRWEAPMANKGGAAITVFNFEVHRDTFTGTGGPITRDAVHDPTVFRFVDGKIHGDEISFTWFSGEQRMFLVTGRLYDDQLNLFMEDAPDKPQAKPGKKTPLTAFRNPSKKPFDWSITGPH